MKLVSLIKRSGLLHGIFIILFACIVRIFGYGLYHVPTVSMENTMMAGELFFSNKAALIFERPIHGDIVAFNDPTYTYAQSRLMRMIEYHVWGPENWTKRVIGVPGDSIKGCIENGSPVLYRNGIKLKETYVQKYNDLLQRTNLLDEFNITLKDNQYWVMGDNRAHSYDSRSFGPLDARLIHGKIVYRLFSMNKTKPWALLDVLMHPVNHWQQLNFDRCMERVL